ncbi:MAG: tripartite tricarboxylate transporter substrate binding protein [Sphaerochaeta sp.]|jgi:tripartite-type tricarboxylate transporter receptor subunit TctC|nr:tripartite tricarboxylate transporter substrate binding protein [Sphaerochaeta sp.]MDX9915897.1 tripartite tricarboxylate transporter substrate binding protein [Sphaerochaeta sp.]
MRKVVVAILSVLLVSTLLFAQGRGERDAQYPTKGIQFIVPYAAGGGTDSLMRLLAKAMEDELGQSVTIVNKAGGLGQVGLTELARAKSDGYTIGALSNLDHILVLFTSDNVSYDYDSLEYLGAINTTANIMYANTKNTGFTSVEQMLSYAKQNPGRLTVSISGKTHLAEVALLEQATGITLTPVMQSSGNDSLKAILGGHVDLAVMDKNFVAQVEGQGVVPLAAFSDERVVPVTDVPTFHELGYNIATETYRVMVAPKGTPAEICTLLTETIKKVSSTDEFIEKMRNMSENYRFLDAEQVKARLDNDYRAVEKLLEEVPGAFN